MTTLQFDDTYNLVAVLAKPAESKGFKQLVDFLNANPIRYALTINLIIYTSCIEQFWATIKVKTVNGEVQLQALVDGKKIIVTEASVKRDLQLNDKEGTDCLPNATIFVELTKIGKPKRKDTEVPQPSGPTTNVADEAVYEEMDDSLERAATSATSLDAERDRVLALENTKTAQAQEITSLKLRVKKLEKKAGSRTHKLKRLYKVGRSARIVSSNEASLGDQEDASKQGRKIDDIDKDTEITLVDETQGRYGDDIMFDVSDLASEEVFVAEKGVLNSKKGDDAQVSTAATTISIASTIPVSVASITDVEITLAQALAELKSAKPTTDASTRPRTKGLVIHEQEQVPTPTVSSQQPSQAKIPNKGKAKMIKPEPVKKLSKKDQLKFDEKWLKGYKLNLMNK
ncbi:hypothetical protein Tco_0843870 [Tanacetum coccineum]